MKANTIDCSEYLSKELKAEIRKTRNFITVTTGKVNYRRTK